MKGERNHYKNLRLMKFGFLDAFCEDGGFILSLIACTVGGMKEKNYKQSLGSCIGLIGATSCLA